MAAPLNFKHTLGAIQNPENVDDNAVLAEIESAVLGGKSAELIQNLVDKRLTSTFNQSEQMTKMLAGIVYGCALSESGCQKCPTRIPRWYTNLQLLTLHSEGVELETIPEDSVFEAVEESHIVHEEVSVEHLRGGMAEAYQSGRAMDFLKGLDKVTREAFYQEGSKGVCLNVVLGSERFSQQFKGLEVQAEAKLKELSMGAAILVADLDLLYECVELDRVGAVESKAEAGNVREAHKALNNLEQRFEADIVKKLEEVQAAPERPPLHVRVADAVLDFFFPQESNILDMGLFM